MSVNRGIGLLILATVIVSIIFAIVISAAIVAAFYVGLHHHPPEATPTPSPTIAPHAIFVANSTGAQVVLTENSSARNVTLSRLESFLASDHTEDHAYVRPAYTCSDFARQLHDSAEAAGIRCGYVTVVYEDADRHGLVVFNTTDRGPVYIDETKGFDAKASIEHWEPYGWASIGSEEYTYSKGNIVDDVYIYW